MLLLLLGEIESWDYMLLSFLISLFFIFIFFPGIGGIRNWRYCFLICCSYKHCADGTDSHCESFGWIRLQDYNPAQRCWAYLNTLAEAHTEQEKQFPFEEELEEADYYPSLPFAALFSSLKVFSEAHGLFCVFLLVQKFARATNCKF